MKCGVCGAEASGFYNNGGLSCSYCRVFFRRMAMRSAIDACTLTGNCVIKEETRSKCRYCRYQKCLQIGMDPNGVSGNGKVVRRAQAGRKNEDTFENLMANVIDFLRLPEPKIKPLGNVQAILRGVVMPFTTEEKNVIQSFKDIDRDAFISIGGWTVELETCLNKIVSGEIKEFPTQLMRSQARSKMYEKWITFAKSLDIFKKLPEADQFMLLNSNMRLVMFIRAAEFFNPKLSGTQQLTIMLHGAFDKIDQLPYLPNLVSVPGKVFSKFPKLHPVNQAFESIQNLDMDKITSYFAILISLFAEPTGLSERGLKSVRATQKHIRRMLYRYFSTTMDPTHAQMKLELIEIIINVLISNEDYLLAN